MKIFVAGATRAIGLPLVRVLRALNHEVPGSRVRNCALAGRFAISCEIVNSPLFIAAMR